MDGNANSSGSTSSSERHSIPATASNGRAPPASTARGGEDQVADGVRHFAKQIEVRARRQEGHVADLKPHLLTDLAAQGLFRGLADVHEAAGDAELSPRRLLGAADEKRPAVGSNTYAAAATAGLKYNTKPQAPQRRGTWPRLSAGRAMPQRGQCRKSSEGFMRSSYTPSRLYIERNRGCPFGRGAEPPGVRHSPSTSVSECSRCARHAARTDPLQPHAVRSAVRPAQRGPGLGGRAVPVGRPRRHPPLHGPRPQSAAMAFNRLADRRIDAANPRTAGRHLPAGTLSVATVAGVHRSSRPPGSSPPRSCSCSASRRTRGRCYLSGPVLLFVLGLLAGQAVHQPGPLLARGGAAARPGRRLDRGEGADGPDGAPRCSGRRSLFWVPGSTSSTPARTRTSTGPPGCTASRPGSGCRPACGSRPGATPSCSGCWSRSAFASPRLGAVYFAGLGLVGGLLVYEHRLVRPDDLPG